MDYQNRVGSKRGGGGQAGWSETNADRRERLRKLALETIDLEKDPYMFKNHLGYFECKLCLTSHVNDGSYLAHTQGRKHQTNLARRAARDQKEGRSGDSTSVSGANTIPVKKNLIKLGRPGYKITKIRDPITREMGLLFQLQYPEIGTEIHPRFRFMSAFEQRIDLPQDKSYQYLVIAAEPYETCGFKIQAKEIDRRPGRLWDFFNPDTKEYFVQFFFRPDQNQQFNGIPGVGR